MFGAAEWAFSDFRDTESLYPAQFCVGPRDRWIVVRKRAILILAQASTKLRAHRWDRKPDGHEYAELEARILAALKAPGRTEGVRKIAKRFGVDPGTVQRISRPLDGGSLGAAA